MLVPTTLLRHETRGQPHYDWLIVPPTGPFDAAGRLWTARVARHWDDWERLGVFTLTPLPPHRRRYLQWEGPLSDGRGHVFHAGRGRVEPHRWADGRIALTLLRPHSTPLGLSLQRLSPGRWRAVVTGESPA